MKIAIIRASGHDLISTVTLIIKQPLICSLVCQHEIYIDLRVRGKECEQTAVSATAGLIQKVEKKHHVIGMYT